MKDLTEIEKKTYDFIKDLGEIKTTNLPNKRMWGSISNLQKLGLIEVFKKYISIFRSRKKNFAKIKYYPLKKCVIFSFHFG